MNLKEMNKELPAGAILSHYRIVSKLGEGGMGKVYLAQDTKLDRKVAIKFLHDELSKDQDKLNRFVQEAKAASALNHPNILTVYEIGEGDGKNYIATELIDGQTLREHLSEQEPLALNTTLKIGVQVAEALSAAHQAGIFHRDIKPENIMIRRDGYAKVLDFGLAKLSEPPAMVGGLMSDEEAQTRVKHQTQPGTIMGTASYMSPEQARGKETDARTDIWSLGVVLYEMLARKVPFTGETVNHIIVSILEKEPLLLTDVPGELQRIVRKALTKDVDMRYQSARDLLIDLKNLRRDLDIQGEIERSVVPNREVSTQSVSESQTQFYNAGPAGAMKSGSVAPTQNIQPSTSSLEYAVTQAKSHKLVTAIIGVVLLGIISAVAYFGFFANRAGKQIESIAVMPFVNESGNADVEYLSDGMTETLIKSLSNLPNLNVKPRSSVFRYKGKDTDLQTIGKELNVQAILHGRVVQRGDGLMLSLELVDVQKDRVIWSEQYDRKQSDLVSLQSEIARDVSSKLKSKLSGADEARVAKTSTADPEAYQAYLKGRYYWNRRTSENLKKAIEQFKSATDRDPNYALAFAGLADCYALLNEYSGVPVTEAAPQARSYAERAIAIDESLAEPHATLGSIHVQLWQWAEAEKEFKRAIELNPNYATAYHWHSITLLYLGRKDESLAMIQRARELDPMSSIIASAFAWVQQMRGDHQASIENLLKLTEFDPTFGITYATLGLSYLKTGRSAEAVAALEKAAQLNRYGVTLGDLGYVYAVTGKRTEALAVIKELEEKYARKETNGLSIACVYAGLGDKDKAFEWLEKDFQNRDGYLPSITASIPLESLRDDPRFKAMLKRMNLPE